MKIFSVLINASIPKLRNAPLSDRAGDALRLFSTCSSRGPAMFMLMMSMLCSAVMQEERRRSRAASFPVHHRQYPEPVGGAETPEDTDRAPADADRRML